MAIAEYEREFGAIAVARRMRKRDRRRASIGDPRLCSVRARRCARSTRRVPCRRLPRIEASFQADGALDVLRGLHITPENARAALTGRTTVPAMGGRADEIVTILRTDLAFGRLIERYALTGFEVVTLLIALAPEFDLRYQKVFAYLQDDVTRKRPTVDLILSLTCASAAERHARRAEFSAGGKLRASSLVEPDRGPQLLTSATARAVRRARRADRSLPPWRYQPRSPHRARLPRFPIRPGAVRLALAGATARELARVARLGVPMWLSGPAGIGTADIAAALAHDAGGSLLTLDARRVASSDIERTLRVAWREVGLRDGWLFIEDADGWIGDADLLAQALRTATFTPSSALSERMPAPLRGVAYAIELAIPAAAERERLWRDALFAREPARRRQRGGRLSARRFEFTPAQIAAAATESAHRADGDLFAAARAQSSDAVRAVARKISAARDVGRPGLATRRGAAVARALPARRRADARARGPGASRADSRGHGHDRACSPAAPAPARRWLPRCIANELGLDLLQDRPVARRQQVHRRNREEPATASSRRPSEANAILFFDEADALFGKRCEVKDAHDRYANIEIATCCSGWSSIDGVAILATNLRQNLDEAFTRRLTFSSTSRFRMKPERRGSVATFGRRRCRGGRCRLRRSRAIRVTGGNIRNIVLASPLSWPRRTGTPSPLAMSATPFVVNIRKRAVCRSWPAQRRRPSTHGDHVSATIADSLAPPTPVRTMNVSTSSAALRMQRMAGNAALNTLTRSPQSSVAPPAPVPAVASAEPAAATGSRRQSTPLSEEAHQQIAGDVDRIVHILKNLILETGDQITLVELVKKYLRLDEKLQLGDETPHLDQMLLKLKMRSFTRRSFASLGVEQHALVYDALWYRLSGRWLDDFKQIVARSRAEGTSGPQSANVENGAALIAKQEAMGMWGMLKGMGTGLVGLAGPRVAQAMGEQFDDAGRIMFGPEWDAGEPLILGMNAGQIGTVGGDLVWTLTTLGRAAGPKGGRFLRSRQRSISSARRRRRLGYWVGSRVSGWPHRDWRASSNDVRTQVSRSARRCWLTIRNSSTRSSRCSQVSSARSWLPARRLRHR